MDTNDCVIRLLSELSGMDEIEPTDKLRAELALDSLQLVTLLVVLEDEFGIVLEQSDMNPFDLVSVADVISLVEKYTEHENHEEEG